MKPDLDVAVPGTLGLIVGGSLTGTFPTASAASPVGISPGIVMASDNTLGSFSPFQGRIYAAFVGYFNVIIDGVKNPTDNTDIFLTFSETAVVLGVLRKSLTTMRVPLMVLLRRAKTFSRKIFSPPSPVPAGDCG